MIVKVKLLKDIVIPAGTIFVDAPVRTLRFGSGHVETVVGLTKNTVGFFNYDICDDKEELKEYFEEIE